MSNLRMAGSISADGAIKLRGRIQGDLADRQRDEAACAEAENAFDDAEQAVCPECLGRNLGASQVCFDCESDLPEFTQEEDE